MHRLLGRHPRTIGLAIAAAGWLAAVAALASPPADGIHAAYVVLAPSADGTVPLARVIVPAGRDCPELTWSGGSVRTVARRNPHPATFPVDVCEARYPWQRSLRVGDGPLTLPAVTRRPSRLIVIGDTGCTGGSWQDCDDPAAWPFPAFASAISTSAPELVIHVGDYDYRGTPGRFTVDGVTHRVYDAGDGLPVEQRCRLPGGYASQNVPGSDHFDAWQNWWVDLFEPARELLRRAPWVFARGNHELCSRAGLGWFYFLDPGSDLLGEGFEQRSCPSPESAEPRVLTPPHRLDLETLVLAVMDTANACDLYPDPTEAYARQLADLGPLPGDRPTWLVTHRPIWGVAKPSDGSGYQSINRTLQAALDRSPLPAAVDLVVAGHMHRFQALAFDPPRAPQLIVGNGGVALVTDPPTGRFEATVDGVRARGFGLDRFGFLEVTLDGGGAWQGRLVDPTRPRGDRLLARCGTDQLPEGFLCAAPGP